MSTYRTLKPIAVSVDNVVHSYRAGLFVELDDEVDGTAGLVARGRIALVSADAPVELVAEPAEEVERERELKDHTVPELIEIAKKAGASEDSVKNLKKAALIEAVGRLTHVTDD